MWKMGGVLKTSKLLKDFLELGKELGKEIFETASHRAKLSTIFDLFTEKVIPSFVSEKELKEYYEKRMEEVNDFIIKL
ncbi:MAG: hypothetical protein ACFFDK_03020 [Promethearchaeota archaeon]